jgi:hypothetical protein
MMFEAIRFLQRRTAASGVLEVVYGDRVAQLSFRWSAPVGGDAVAALDERLSRRLPVDYKGFLLEVSDGALLFYNAAYGGWGYRIFGTAELEEEQGKWRNRIGNVLTDRFLAFAEILSSDHNVLAFDLDRPFKGPPQSHTVLEAGAYDPVEHWPKASRSFGEWLEHLIIAQGDAYWAWQ